MSKYKFWSFFGDSWDRPLHQISWEVGVSLRGPKKDGKKNTISCLGFSGFQAVLCDGSPQVDGWRLGIWIEIQVSWYFYVCVDPQVISDKERQLQRFCVTNYLEKWTIFDNDFFFPNGW